MPKKVIILLVNEFKGYGAYADRMSTFIHNLQLINPTYYKKFREELRKSDREQLIKILVLGKYIILIEMEKKSTECIMIFLDIQKDDEKGFAFFYGLMENYEDEKLAEAFAIAVKKHEKSYDQNYGLVELRIDKSVLN